VTRVRWTINAANDLASIAERIRKDNPSAALKVARTICKGVADLGVFPNRGRIGLVENTREVIFPPWPYIVVYEINQGTVNVLRVRHASQDWP
jgi:toxin ParE1/3/4